MKKNDFIEMSTRIGNTKKNLKTYMEQEHGKPKSKPKKHVCLVNKRAIWQRIAMDYHQKHHKIIRSNMK